jgi:hypothetical protein
MRERGRKEHGREQQAGDRGVAGQRNAFERRQQQRPARQQREHYSHTAVAARGQWRFVAGLERRRRRH